MPAIDLPVVRARAVEIAALFPDIPAVLPAVHTMLGDYSDLTHRPSRVLTASTSENTLRAPMPVVRAIVTALRAPAKAAPPLALELAQGLWAAGSREERRIAAELLGVVAASTPAEALALIERWLPEIESAATADALGEHAFGPLMRASPAAHLERARTWVGHPHKWIRRFGVAALGPLAKDKKWDDLPGALEVLRGAMAETEPEVCRAVAEIIADLIPKSPLELSRFLREQAAHANSNTHWIIRAAMGKLPPEEQEAIIAAMRA